MAIKVEIDGQGNVAEFPDGTDHKVIDHVMQRDFFGVGGIKPNVPKVGPYKDNVPKPAPAPTTQGKTPYHWSPEGMFSEMALDKVGKENPPPKAKPKGNGTVTPPNWRQPIKGGQTVTPTPKKTIDKTPGLMFNAQDIVDILEPMVKPLRGAGASLFASVNMGAKEFSKGFDQAATFMSKITGMPKGGVAINAAKTYEENEEYWRKKAREDGVGALTELLMDAAGGFPGMAADWSLSLPWAGMKGAGAAMEKGENPVWGAMVKAMERGMMGKLMHQFAQLTTAPRMAASGGLFAGQAVSQGEKDPKKIAKAGLQGAILGAPGSGKIGVHDIVREMWGREKRGQAENVVEKPSHDVDPEIVKKRIGEWREELTAAGKEHPLFLDQGKLKAVKVDGKTYLAKEGHNPYDGIPMRPESDIETGYVGEDGKFTTRAETEWKEPGGTNLGMGLGAGKDTFAPGKGFRDRKSVV